MLNVGWLNVCWLNVGWLIGIIWQYRHAKALMDNAKDEITGPISYRHSFVHMPTLNVTLKDDQGWYVCICICCNHCYCINVLRYLWFVGWFVRCWIEGGAVQACYGLLFCCWCVCCVFAFTLLSRCSFSCLVELWPSCVAIGTTDGPGMFGFTQGTTSGNKFWDTVCVCVTSWAYYILVVC